MFATQILPVAGFAEPLSSWLHLIAGVVAITLGVRQIVKLPNRRSRIAFGFFLFGACFVFSMSGVFHLLDPGTAEREVLRRLDYSAIWTLVAGTLTTLCFVRYRGAPLWLLLVTLWAIAIVGIVMNSVFLAETPEGLSLGMYFVLAGLGFTALWGLWEQHDMSPIALGCGAYTMGALAEYFQIPEVIPGVLAYHELFHIAVIVAVTIHWRCLVVMLEAAPADADETSANWATTPGVA
jgi:hemolysin III